ncbi:MAG: hypothetical protein WBA43_19950 [Elainellaceae cyanobacterium]
MNLQDPYLSITVYRYEFINSLQKTCGCWDKCWLGQMLVGTNAGTEGRAGQAMGWDHSVLRNYLGRSR